MVAVRWQCDLLYGRLTDKAWMSWTCGPTTGHCLVELNFESSIGLFTIKRSIFWNRTLFFSLKNRSVTLNRYNKYIHRQFGHEKYISLQPFITKTWYWEQKLWLNTENNMLTLNRQNYSIWIFTHLKLCLADAIHNFKWVKIIPIWQNGGQL